MSSCPHPEKPLQGWGQGTEAKTVDTTQMLRLLSCGPGRAEKEMLTLWVCTSLPRCLT